MSNRGRARFVAMFELIPVFDLTQVANRFKMHGVFVVRQLGIRVSAPHHSNHLSVPHICLRHVSMASQYHQYSRPVGASQCIVESCRSYPS